MKDYKEAFKFLNSMYEEEVNFWESQTPRLICSNGSHTTSLKNVEIGSKCICGGIWQRFKKSKAK